MHEHGEGNLPVVASSSLTRLHGVDWGRVAPPVLVHLPPLSPGAINGYEIRIGRTHLDPNPDDGRLPLAPTTNSSRSVLRRRYTGRQQPPYGYVGGDDDGPPPRGAVAVHGREAADRAGGAVRGAGPGRRGPHGEAASRRTTRSTPTTSSTRSPSAAGSSARATPPPTGGDPILVLLLAPNGRLMHMHADVQRIDH
jgi:hypothetical protein